MNKIFEVFLGKIFESSFMIQLKMTLAQGQRIIFSPKIQVLELQVTQCHFDKENDSRHDQENFSFHYH